MNETEFLRYSDQLFAHIEDQLDQCGADFDCEHNGNVLTIEADNGTQIIVNRHTPNQELWIATTSPCATANGAPPATAAAFSPC